jgi:hypothetical protein
LGRRMLTRRKGGGVFRRRGSVLCYQMMGLGIFENRRLSTSSRHHESGVWKGLNMLEVEVVWILRGATGGKRGPVRGIAVMCLVMIYRG